MFINKILVMTFIAFVSQVSSAADIIIYDASGTATGGILWKGVKVMENGKKVGWRSRLYTSGDAKPASYNLMVTERFFRKNFGLDSYDGKGSPIEAVVGLGSLGFIGLDIGRFRQNAAWAGQDFKRFFFGTGKKNGMDNFAQALDVIAHEYTHAIVEYTAKLEKNGQPGALNEHLADFFGQMVQVASGQGKDDFLIGETTLSIDLKKRASKHYKHPVEGLRDMLNPHLGLSPQPIDMKGIPKEMGADCKPTLSNDFCGVHILSGIPNRALATAVKALGWKKVGDVVYNVMTRELKPNSDFVDYAQQLRSECSRQLTMEECAWISYGLSVVGL